MSVRFYFVYCVFCPIFFQFLIRCSSFSFPVSLDFLILPFFLIIPSISSLCEKFIPAPCFLIYSFLFGPHKDVICKLLSYKSEDLYAMCVHVFACPCVCVCLWSCMHMNMHLLKMGFRQLRCSLKIWKLNPVPFDFKLELKFQREDQLSGFHNISGSKDIFTVCFRDMK